MWQLAALGAYAGILSLLSVFATHRLMLALAARRFTVREPAAPRTWPTVLVQLPIYNEQHVFQRLIDSVCALDYPTEKLTIQVLDDSTDARPAASYVRRMAATHPIVHIKRPTRRGYKAGALKNGLQQSTSELVAVFDADFVPQADFLERLVPHFGDPAVGMVQARWGHLNENDNALTAAQAVLLDGHFLNEHTGRAARGCFFNFNGTAGIWRRSCIDDAGGWLSRSITEDLDLSYRAQLKGWRFVFRPDVVVPAELPADVDALKSQQHRWAKGSVETARYVLPAIWKAPALALRCKIEATFHLLGNAAYPLVILLALMMPAVMVARSPHEAVWVYVVDASLFLSATGSLVLFYITAVRRAGRDWRSLSRLPMTLAVGVGLAINNSRGLFEALVGHRSAFVRTPKLGDVAPSRRRPASRNARRQALLELLLGAHIIAALVVAALSGHLVALPFLGLLGWGFLVLGAASLFRGRWLGRSVPGKGVDRLLPRRI